jgi:S1-C subfamily serine protease
VVPEAIRKRAGLAALSVAAAAAMPVAADDSAPATIARIKASIVAVGTFERLRNPQFGFAGTGFVVGDGLTVATNDHVVPKTVSTERGEDIAVAVPVPGGAAQIRIARRMAADAGSDLALLRMDGKPLPALAFGDAQAVREGESYLVTGFPIGSVLGLFPVTHRAMIAAVTPRSRRRAPTSSTRAARGGWARHRSPCSSSTGPPTRATAAARSTTRKAAP